MSHFPPEVFIIGAQKCGTTSLASLLDANPEICLSEPKESNYYSVNQERDESWYRECFADPELTLVDASTTYTMASLDDRALNAEGGRHRQNGVPGRIHAARPDAKLIYIIREPVARTYSHFWHNRKYGYEKRPLKAAIERDPLYLHISMYYAQLELYLALFPREQLLIVQFEELVRDQLTVLNRCEAFIGVTPSSSVESRKDNQGAQYNSLGRWLIRNPVSRNFDRFLPAGVKRGVKRLLSQEIPALDPSDAEWIRGQLASDQQSLEREFGLSYLTNSC
jgi:hypothetical protein